MMPHDVDIMVGKNIRKLRTLRGISQTELAEACGVTFQQMQKYEGAGNRVSASRLVMISRALHVSLLELFEEIAFDEETINTRQGLELIKNFSKVPEAKQDAIFAWIKAEAGQDD